MINEEELVQNIKNSKLFNEKLKAEILNHLGSLNEFQKNKILEAINYEKNLALNYLKSLKSSEVIDFEEIKNNIENLHRNYRNNLELNEEIQKEKELWEILNSLDFA